MTAPGQTGSDTGAGASGEHLRPPPVASAFRLCDKGYYDKLLEMAVARRLPKEGLLAHSDRGSQYASEHYQTLLLQHGIECSMSGKGQCWDNAPMESFFASLKT